MVEDKIIIFQMLVNSNGRFSNVCVLTRIRWKVTNFLGSGIPSNLCFHQLIHFGLIFWMAMVFQLYASWFSWFAQCLIGEMLLWKHCNNLRDLRYCTGTQIHVPKQSHHYHSGKVYFCLSEELHSLMKKLYKRVIFTVCDIIDYI